MTARAAQTLGVYTATRVRGFAPWSPRKKTERLLADIRAVLDEYADHLPLTARQLFYALVGRDQLDKTEHAYAQLCEVVNRARRAGLLEWAAFRDDGTIVRALNAYDGPTDFIAAVRRTVERSYCRDRLAGQERRLEVWCEAGGMVPQLVRVCEPFGVLVHSSGGFYSTTAKYETARRLANESRPTLILHVGDLDPSGVAVFDALAADIRAFISGDSGLGGAVPEFIRLVVTPKQVKKLRLPTAPPKKTDRRGGFVGETTQAEAIPPDVLAQIVQDAIESHLDLDLLAGVRAAEERDRRQLLRRLKRGA